MKQENLGYIFAVFAFTIWGVFPIYFNMVSFVNPFEILVYRMVFSVFTLLPFFFIKKNFQGLLILLSNKRSLFYLFSTSLLISINWFVFIYAVVNGKILETSLGYYINPLISFLLAFIFLNERLNKNKYLAIFVASLGVLYQVIIMGYIPFISLILGFSFGFYGLLRKKVNVKSIEGLFIEVLLLFPFAAFYLYYVYDTRGLAVFNSDFYGTFLIVISGILTIIPLLLFNGAATRIKLSTMGFFQYIGPSVSFLIAIFVYEEEFNIHKFITFCFIWLALIIFSFDSIKSNRKR